MKYYYTDPLKAVWMSEKFDVRLLQEDGESDRLFTHALPASDDHFDIGGAIVGIKYSVNRKIYVHPDDYGVFEPREGDMINNAGVLGGVTDEGFFREANIEEPNDEVIYKGGYEIIQRDGTAFFMPEVEQ